jgi:hypothetical protein
MVAGIPPHDADDDGSDDLAALDFSYAGHSTTESDLDALGDYGSVADGADDDGLPVPTFTVTNPPETVSVSTYLDGRVQHITLSPKAAAMTETDLADEIVVIANLATQDARSAQYAFMLEGMRDHGHDDPDTRDFLQRDLALPTPEEARQQRTETFATRYASSHE